MEARRETKSYEGYPWHEKNKEALKEYARKYREGNPEYKKRNADKAKKDRLENPEYFKAREFAREMKKYNTTVEWYRDRLIEQSGLCAICSHLSHHHGTLQRLQVDHDHTCCDLKTKSCGECLRGLLCADCNVLLSYLERFLKEASVVAERHTWTRRALNYIEDYKKTWTVTFPTDGVGVLDGICGTYLNSKDRVDVSEPRRFLVGQMVHIYDNKLQTQKCSSVIARISDSTLVFTEPLNGDIRCGDLIVMTQETQ